LPIACVMTSPFRPRSWRWLNTESGFGTARAEMIQIESHVPNDVRVGYQSMPRIAHARHSVKGLNLCLLFTRGLFLKGGTIDALPFVGLQKGKTKCDHFRAGEVQCGNFGKSTFVNELVAFHLSPKHEAFTFQHRRHTIRPGPDSRSDWPVAVSPLLRSHTYYIFRILRRCKSRNSPFRNNAPRNGARILVPGWDLKIQVRSRPSLAIDHDRCRRIHFPYPR
jgi:hypothetical protein